MFTRILHPLFTLDKLVRLSNQKVVLPFYHTISNEHLPHIKNLYTIRNVRLFEQDLDYLHTNFEAINIEKLYQIVLHKEKLKKPVFHLTFDDGLQEIYSIIAPLLYRKGIPATFFLNTSFIDNKALFFRFKISLIIEELKKCPDKLNALSNQSFKNFSTQLLAFTYHQTSEIDWIAEKIGISFSDFLQKQKPYLCSEQIIELQTKGFTFGAHSEDHPFFKNIATDEQHRQVRESLRILKHDFNMQDAYFAFPFSDEGVSKAFIHALHKQHNCKLSFGISGLKKDVSPFHLHRIPMEQSTLSAENILKHEYLYFTAKSIVNKNIYIRK